MMTDSTAEPVAKTFFRGEIAQFGAPWKITDQGHKDINFFKARHIFRHQKNKNHRLSLHQGTA